MGNGAQIGAELAFNMMPFQYPMGNGAGNSSDISRRAYCFNTLWEMEPRI